MSSERNIWLKEQQLINSELLWAVYAAVGAMETSGRQDWKDLAAGWSDWLDYTKITAKKVSTVHLLPT